MANAIQFTNGPLPQAANTTLTGSIPASGGGTVTVASAADLPAKGPFLLVVDNERLEVDSISGTTLTFLAAGRGQEGTTAAAHSSGAEVYHVLSAATLLRAIGDRTGVVLAPDPTGVAATDKANLDAAAAANTVVQLRPGTYEANPLATLPSNCKLRGWPGKQTTLRLADQGATAGTLVTLSDDCELEGLVLDGNKAAHTSGVEWDGLVQLAGNRARVTGCTVQNCLTSGVYAIGDSAPRVDCRVEDTLFLSNDKTDVFAEKRVHRLKVRRCKSEKAGSAALNFVKVKGVQNDGEADTSEGTRVLDCEVDYSGCTLPAGTNVLAIEIYGHAHFALVQGNTIIGPADASATGLFFAISIDSSYWTSVVGNVVRRSGTSNQVILYGVELAASPFCTVAGNTIRGCLEGISISSIGGERPDSCTITGNTVSDCHNYGLQATNGWGLVISGNTWQDCGHRYVFLNGSQFVVQDCTIVGNTFHVVNNDRSAANGGLINGIYLTNGGGHTIADNVFGTFPRLSTPSAPTATATTGGSLSAATYTYRLVAKTPYGKTLASAQGSAVVSGGNNAVNVTWSTIPGASEYEVYGRSGTEQLLATVRYNVTSFLDTGAVTPSGAQPTANTSAGSSTVGLNAIYCQGTALIERALIHNNRASGAPPSSAGGNVNDFLQFDGAIDHCLVAGNQVENFNRSFVIQFNTPGANPNYFIANHAGTLPYQGLKVFDVVRRIEEDGDRPSARMALFDDFAAGALTSGNVGDLGWSSTVVSSGTITRIAALAGRPGIVKVSSGATSGGTYSLHLNEGPTLGAILPADSFDMIVSVRPNQAADANTIFRVGLGNSAAAQPPADGIYVEKAAADTQWFGVTRAASSQTRTAAFTGYATNTWFKLRIRRIDASTIGFTVDGQAEKTLTATIPTVALTPFIQVANSAASAKTFDVDYADVTVTFLSR